MSDHVYGSTGSPRSAFFGAARASNPRIHSMQSPYARPRSSHMVDGPNNDSSSSLVLSNGSPAQRSPTKQGSAPSTRVAMMPKSSSSNSLGSLRRSGSEASLLTGLKSLFSRPFSWLASPSKDMSGAQARTRAGALLAREEDIGQGGGGGGTKRDSYSSFGPGAEDPDSPTDRREGKRVRRRSPPLSRQRGVYDPEHASGPDDNDRHLAVTGRAITGTMLPSLPARLALDGHGQTRRSKADTNFSRPLPSSQSMHSYLDPPASSFDSPTRRTTRSTARATGLGKSESSRKLNLSEFGVQGGMDDDNDMDDAPRGSSALRNGTSLRATTRGAAARQANTDDDALGGGEKKTQWSPWKDRYRNSMTPVAKRERSLYASGGKDYTLPSISPFQPGHVASPLRQMSPARGLTRSNTTRELRRDGSMLSDVDMDRAGSPRKTRMSMAPGQNVIRNDRMSMDPERDASSLDWFMRDRWTREPGSPASAAAAQRIGSVMPQPSLPPIRRGQMVWAGGDKGFVRESDLKAAEQPKPVHHNDAERILYALESMRKTPLTEARSGTSLPSELIGSSSRQLRKAINVPLATAQAGESARRRRDKDRLGEDFNVMVSPYGRRKQTRRAERAPDAMDEDYRPSRSSRSASVDDRTETASQVSEQSGRQFSVASDRTRSPAAPPTPRRSTRINKRNEHAVEEEEATPKAKRSTRGKASQQSAKKGAHSETTAAATPKTGRKTRKASSEPRRSPSPAPASQAPNVPTITETAPSPNQPQRTSGASTYQPRPDGAGSGGSRGGSSLRARTEGTKRTHTGAASYQSSRATTPNSGNGRFSANEDDLPPLEELEQLQQPKISLGGLSGLKFAGFGQAASKPANGGSNDAAGGTTGVGLAPPGAQATGQASTSSSSALGLGGLSVPSNGRPGAGPLSRLNATRPRASSPLASAPSIIAAPDSPPNTKTSSSAATAEPPASTLNGFGFFPLGGGAASTLTAEASKPPANLFAGFGGGSGADGESAAKKSAGGLGIGKPSQAPPSLGAAQSTTSRELAPSGIPDFFGKSAANSGMTTPTADNNSSAMPATLDFGIKRKSDDDAGNAPVKGPATFTFGGEKKSEAAAPGPSGGGFSFGAPAASAAAPAAPASASFSFGAPPKPAETTSTPAAPAFSFGGSSAAAPAASADKPAEAPKPAFGFGSATAGTTKPAAPAGGFSFGAPATSSTTAADKPATQSAFSFGGAASSTTPAAPAAAEAPKTSGFSFGAPATASPAASKPAETPKPAFSFGAPSAPTPAPVDASKDKPAPAAFTFGAPAASPAQPATAPATAGFSFGAPAAPASATPPASAAPATFTFGASTPAAPAAAPTSAGFSFGAPASSAAPTNPFASGSSAFGAPKAPEAPKSNPFASTPAAASTTGFGQPATAGFGQPANNASQAPAAPFTFGAAPSTPATPAANLPSTPFTFSSQPTTPVTPGFGNGAAAPQSNGFGAPAAPASNGFGFVFGSTTPAAAPPSAPQNNNTSFGGFGAGQPQQQQPTTPGGSTFTFGAPANNTNAQAGGFSFGQSAPPPGSTTPAGNPPANNPFGFGNAAAGGVAPAMNNAPRFGSPSPAIEAGGFSLGAAAQAPGSPSGRPIKALRRGTKR